VTWLNDLRVTGSIPVVGFLFQSFLGTDKGKQPFVLDERKQSFILYNYRHNKLPSNPAGCTWWCRCRTWRRPHVVVPFLSSLSSSHGSFPSPSSCSGPILSSCGSPIPILVSGPGPCVALSLGPHVLNVDIVVPVPASGPGLFVTSCPCIDIVVPGPGPSSVLMTCPCVVIVVVPGPAPGSDPVLMPHPRIVMVIPVPSPGSVLTVCPYVVVVVPCPAPSPGSVLVSCPCIVVVSVC
jgi:hypothetical protein